MAVVINEFETVAAPPQQQRGSGEADSGGGEGSSQPSEHEIEKLVELHVSRNERVRAY
jgi:hypothetical protein